MVAIVMVVMLVVVVMVVKVIMEKQNKKKHARFLVDLNDLTTGHNLHTLLDTDVDVDIDSDSDVDVDMMWLGCDITIFNTFTVWTNIYFWTSFEFWRQVFILSQSPACFTCALQRKLFPGRY